MVSFKDKLQLKKLRVKAAQARTRQPTVSSHVKPILALSQASNFARAPPAAPVNYFRSPNAAPLQGSAALESLSPVRRAQPTQPPTKHRARRLSRHQQPKLVTKPSLRPKPHAFERRVTPRQIRRPAEARAYWLKDVGWGNVHDLQALLQQDVTLFAIDTESERHGIGEKVVEIGVTTIRTVDIKGLEPGSYAQNWLAKAKHYHMVIDVARKKYLRMGRSLFGKSVLLDSQSANAELRNIMESCTQANGERRLALVGHSLPSDLAATSRCPDLKINLLNTGIDNLHIHMLLDTLTLAGDARKAGVHFPALRLACVARTLGVDPKYHNKGGGLDLKGTHNASNDAAYTMMGLLRFAADWDSLVARGLTTKPKGTTPSTWFEWFRTVKWSKY